MVTFVAVYHPPFFQYISRDPHSPRINTDKYPLKRNVRIGEFVGCEDFIPLAIFLTLVHIILFIVTNKSDYVDRALVLIDVKVGH